MDENALYKTASCRETPKPKFLENKRHRFDTKRHALKQRQPRWGRQRQLVGGERVILDEDGLRGGCQRGGLLVSAEIDGTLFRRFRPSRSMTRHCCWRPRWLS